MRVLVGNKTHEDWETDPETDTEKNTDVERENTGRQGRRDIEIEPWSQIRPGTWKENNKRTNKDPDMERAEETNDKTEAATDTRKKREVDVEADIDGDR